MHLFYLPDLNSGMSFLPEEESKHCIRVMRLAENDTISITDGYGKLVVARIAEANPKKCGIEIVSEKIQEKPLWNIHIAIAPTKNSDRTEWFLEKAVELGIQEISFLKTDRSERKSVNLDRMQKIAASAMKQSLKFFLPEINDLINFKDFVKKTESKQKFIAHLVEGMERNHLKELVKPNNSYVVMIGPEGDFSPAEVEVAINHGYTPASLGNNRLRTETAALAACHILNLTNE